MASSSCWKCLTRPYIPLGNLTSSSRPSTRPALASSFSTSIARRAAPIQKAKARGIAGGKGQKKTTPGKTLKIKKKAFVKTGRPPAPGERKAIRKRIVLSNSNALEVSTMADMTAELDTTQIGKVVGLPGLLVDQLRALEAFKTTQGWGLFRRPAMLIREESVEIAKMIQEAQNAKETSVTILDGERGAGKSMMLLQAMATAFIKGWIVLSIPEGEALDPSKKQLIDAMICSSGPNQCQHRLLPNCRHKPSRLLPKHLHLYLARTNCQSQQRSSLLPRAHPPTQPPHPAPIKQLTGATC